MELQSLLADDEAVSPVIGVILMVAITVILAAVIGTFVLGLGDQVSNTSPTASFTFDGGGGDQVTVTHEGGDKVDSSTVDLVYTDTSDTSQEETWGDGTTDITAGSSKQTANAVKGETTMRVVWNAPNGGDSSTLGKYEVPG